MNMKEMKKDTICKEKLLELESEMQHLASREELIGYCKCNIIKYLGRFKYEGNAKEDIVKAMQYTCWRFDLMNLRRLYPNNERLISVMGNITGTGTDIIDSRPNYYLGFFFYLVKLFNIHGVEKIVLEIKEDLENKK